MFSTFLPFHGQSFIVSLFIFILTNSIIDSLQLLEVEIESRLIVFLETAFSTVVTICNVCLRFVF